MTDTRTESGSTTVREMVNDVFGALAHPVRRSIVEQLAQGPATVGVRHLKVLEDGGVVIRTVDGRTHRLGLNGAALRDTVGWLECQRAAWERMVNAVQDHPPTQTAEDGPS